MNIKVFKLYWKKNTTSHWSRGGSEVEAPLHESSISQNFKGDLSRLPASFIYLFFFNSWALSSII